MVAVSDTFIMKSNGYKRRRMLVQWTILVSVLTGIRPGALSLIYLSMGTYPKLSLLNRRRKQLLSLLFCSVI